ncbi:MAG: SMP-30/gluconolactonase/LRE family protein [Rhodobacteraceae bacterium]|nr:SMP-30/gluconolactonase/LRE family protein [Paracoccaceae bacterium]
MTPYDTRSCTLGEGPLWHPERQQLFWFDIMGHHLLTQDANGPRQWQFDEAVSAAGWVDQDTLLIASASGLWRFDIRSGARYPIVEMEAENSVTRSNDGHADPWGGFWIGTMGHHVEPKAGAIYCFYCGTLTELYDEISVPNSISFNHDQRYAYFTDTPTQIVLRQALNPEQGWPLGDPELWLYLRAGDLNPDGAVIDAAGQVWVAQWGTVPVVTYDPDGTFQSAIPVEVRQTTCPAFGGPDFTTLYCTSAAVNLPAEIKAAQPANGMTLASEGHDPGQRECKVPL